MSEWKELYENQKEIALGYREIIEEMKKDRKKKHCCHIYSTFFCFENIYGELIIKEDIGINDIPEFPCLPVTYCPVCGKKADE